MHSNEGKIQFTSNPSGATPNYSEHVVLTVQGSMTGGGLRKTDQTWKMTRTTCVDGPEMDHLGRKSIYHHGHVGCCAPMGME